jgi:uncharacterized phage protein (TIGR02218 family)
MRNVDPGLAAHLAQGATNLCRCWLLQRADGTAMGFTDHDNTLSFEGDLYAATSGMDASALQFSAGLSVDNAQAIGALSATGLTEVDILSGKYDGAEVRHWLVNWKDTDQRILLFRGSLGEIRRGSGVFEVEMRGLSEALNQPRGRAYLRQCDAVLGDERCGFDEMTPGFFGDAVVERFSGRRVFYLNGLAGFAEDWFVHGRVEWTSGENTERGGIVKTDRLIGNTRLIELWEEAFFAVAAGDGLRLFAGCDKQAGTCKDKFANFLNFRGFPQMPGDDWTLAYPISGGDNSGGSLT